MNFSIENLEKVSSESIFKRCHSENGNFKIVLEIEAIDERVKSLVDECEKFAEDSPFPEVQQLYDVVYEQENYPFIPHRL